MPLTLRCAIALVLGLLTIPLAAEEAVKAEAAKSEAKAEAIPAPYKSLSVHKLRTGNSDLNYNATAEEIYLKDAQDKPVASFFTISYEKISTGKSAERPLTFVFNGGPGSSSIWLHFGLVGPQVIDIPGDASDPGAAPYHLRDNPATLLRATDLVFVDPVGTGFSKALGEKKDKDYWGFDEDADSVAEFMRTYITQHGRWNSPKYLLGESYGGIRSGLLVPRLQDRFSMALNGVILISPALNMGTLPFFTEGNDLPYSTHLPALAASALYHHKLSDSWASERALLDEVEAFAGSEYLTALFKGDTLDKASRQRIAEKLHRYTGLKTDYILRANLRIDAFRFIKELKRDEGQAIGLLDGRYVQDEIDGVGSEPDSDAFNSKTSSIYVSNFQNYLRNELKVDWTRRFYPSNDEANQSWARPRNGNSAFAGYIDVTRQLAQGTKDNSALRVFVAGGYHDLTTSYFATQYMLQHSSISARQLTMKNYEGGHMMYLYPPSLTAVSNDIVAFIEANKNAGK